MQDFSTKHRSVVHFGLWAEEGADTLGKRDAIRILEGVAKLTAEEDMRSDDVDDALTYLSQFNTRERPFRDFRDALGLGDPLQRAHAVRHALVRIKLALSQ